jgi:hypothetical protein
MVTRTPTYLTPFPSLGLWIEEILPFSRRVIVPVDEVFNDRKIRVFQRPATPITDFAEIPTFLARKVLRTPAPEGMCPITLCVSANVE